MNVAQVEPKQDRYVPRLKAFYEKEGLPLLLKKFAYKNVMQVPKLLKIVVSMMAKEAIINSKVIKDHVLPDLMLITGQKPVPTKAKKSISGFKLREGFVLGGKVTLRGNMMYEFLDRFVNIALPRTRDFKGFSVDQFDGHGNLSVGVKEQIIFPEIDYDKIDKIRGLNITFVTSSKNDKEAKAFLEIFDIPFIAD